MTTPKTSFSFKLSGEEQSRLERILKTGNYRPVRVEHTRIAAETEDFRVCLYKSGKCLAQGKGAEEFVSFVLEPLVLKQAGLGYEEILSPGSFQPHMGIDESGKGDYFGPLVIAAAYIDPALAETMRKMDVRDSKTIKSDKKALEMGSQLRKLLGRRFSLVKIGPSAYNRLYSKIRNVNSLLAWAHARAIENLLETVPACPKAISDQFGEKSLIENALMKKGRKIELIQQPKAESDLAVAAASIIAREAFLRDLFHMKSELGMAIPKGASDTVKKTAVEIIKIKGPETLVSVAKCHFRTTDSVLAELGLSRSNIGPEALVVSRPAGKFFRRGDKT